MVLLGSYQSRSAAVRRAARALGSALALNKAFNAATWPPWHAAWPAVQPVASDAFGFALP